MNGKKLLIASDHAGFNLKTFLIKEASEKLGLKFIDLGVESADRADYPDYAKKLCKSLLNGEADQGILICGSGIGMSMAANRFKGIRAALVETEKSAALSRQHNDSNVLCMGERIISNETALKIIEVWLNTEFEGGRHKSRVEKIEI